MMDLILGGEDRHLQRPFCSSGGCPVASPLTYEKDSSEVCGCYPHGENVAVAITLQARATAPAAAAQIGKFYRLPTVVGAGMTDSKLADNQAGYEKGVRIALPAHTTSGRPRESVCASCSPHTIES